MKILFQTNIPFGWAHGGCQLLVERVMAEVARLGAEVEPVRWWDPKQTGDILQLFCYPREEHIYARKKGLKIATYVFLDGFTAKGPFALMLRVNILRFLRRFVPDIALKQGWCAGSLSDALIFPSQYEATLGQRLFEIESGRTHVILHGVDTDMQPPPINIPATNENGFLISIGTIDPRKNSLLLAQLARESGITVMFVGKPYDPDDPYFQEFKKLIDNKHVIYKGYVSEAEKKQLLLSSRGFVTLSRFESGCIAALEAFSLGCRVLLPDLPWAKGTYGGYAEFVNISNHRLIKKALKKFFFDSTSSLPRFPVQTWADAGERYFKVYKSLLGQA